jgi:ubiquinone/menaquinone biosynthesis C-methylase UbiE
MNREKNRDDRELWDKFWSRDRDIKKVYSNEGRVFQNLSKIVDVNGKRILEVGGGSGRDSLEMMENGAECFIVDYTMTPLKIVKSLAKDGEKVPGLVCGDALSLPFKDDSMDIVFHQGLMEHFHEPDELLRENRRVLRDGGHLLVDVPQRYHIYTLLKIILIRLNKWFAGWETQYSIRELEKIIESHNLKPVLVYGDWMSPSIFYRLLREVFFAIGVELPLYPKGPSRWLRRARIRMKEWLKARRAFFYSFHVIGVIGRKPER